MESRIEDHESRFVRLESSIGQLQTDMNIVKSMLKKLVARDERKANGGKDPEEESLVINQGTDMDAIKAKFEKFMGRFQKEKKSNEDKEQEGESSVIIQGTDMDAIKAKFERFMRLFQKEKKLNEEKEQEGKSPTILQGT